MYAAPQQPEYTFSFYNKRVPRDPGPGFEKSQEVSFIKN